MPPTVQDVFDRVRSEHARIPHLILEFVDLPTLAAMATTFQAWTAMLADPKFWTSLDLRGSKNGPVTLGRALKVPKIAAGQLAHVNLEFCKEMTDDDIAALPGNLEYLNLNALHKLTPEGVTGAATKSGATLTRLELYWHHALPNDALVNVAKGCTKLTDLNLSGCQCLEDSGVRAVSRSCGGLMKLNLTRCPLLTDDAISFLCPRLKGLVSLNLYANSQFTDVGYLAIASLHRLKDLDLCGAGKITAEAVAAIARGCPSMEYLNLTWCVNVNDEALAVVAEHCTRLVLLSVYGLRGVTDATLAALARPGRCSTTLTTLDVHGCCNVKRQSEVGLLELFPKLTCFTHHS